MPIAQLEIRINQNFDLFSKVKNIVIVEITVYIRTTGGDVAIRRSYDEINPA